MKPHYIAIRENILNIPRMLNEQWGDGYQFVQAVAPSPDSKSAILIFENREDESKLKMLTEKLTEKLYELERLLHERS